MSVTFVSIYQQRCVLLSFQLEALQRQNHIYLMLHIRIMISGNQTTVHQTPIQKKLAFFHLQNWGVTCLYLEHNNNNHHTYSILRTYLMPSVGLGSSHPFPHLILKSLIKQYYYCHFVVGGNRPTEVKKLAQGHLAPRQRCQDLKPGVSYSERCAFSATLHCIPWSLCPAFCLDGCK